MPRYFVTLSYNGKNYVGWQMQPNGVSVQQVLQNAFSTILRDSIEVTGAGRTDSGVHAKKMYAHFDVQNPVLDKTLLIKKLNSFLPKDISIHDICEVNRDAHARFSAISRTYKYYITTEKDPFLHEYKLKLFSDPDLMMMNHLCEVLKEYEDFTSFSKLHTDVNTNICHIYEARWEQKENNYVFTITANRFLRNMVRAIVGTLLDAGKGNLDEQGFRHIIEQKNRQLAGNSAPGHALFLYDISYPEDIWI